MADTRRIRELVDEHGVILRVSIDQWRDSAIVILERRDIAGSPHVILDTFAVEMLSGYILAARLAIPDSLAGESLPGDFPTEFALFHEEPPAIILRQPAHKRHIYIPIGFWDRLYAEICLILPHTRARARLVHDRLLH